MAAVRFRLDASTVRHSQAAARDWWRVVDIAPALSRQVGSPRGNKVAVAVQALA